MESPETAVATEKTLAAETAVTFRSFPFKSVFLVLFLALVTRTLWAVAMTGEPTSDARAYTLLARQLAAGGTYGFDGTPYSFWPVGYPFWLSLQFRLFGENSALITATSIVLSVVTVGLSIVLALQWFRNRSVAVVAGAFLALYPAYIQMVSIRVSEIPFTLFLLLGVISWGNRRQLSIKRALLTGFFLGLAAYVRPLALGVVFPLAIARWLSRCSIKTVIIESCVVFAVVAAVVAPWTYRNFRIYERFVPISTNGGMCFFYGNNPLAPDEVEASIEPDRDFKDDAARDAYCSAEAVKHIRSDPVAFVKRTIRKALMMWEGDTVGVVWNEPAITARLGSHSIRPLKIVSQVYWMAFGVLCITFVCVAVLRGAWRSVLGNSALWIALSFTGVYAVTYSQDRYHFPLVVLLAPLAAASLVGVIRRSWPEAAVQTHCQDAP
ncbi:MAG: glycosyltransferase family 39 protein [Phycisphaerales bacterium]|nr:MAG: glycosyltransferase family 39 protein [Phycisphaerales bacterium]